MSMLGPFLLFFHLSSPSVSSQLLEKKENNEHTLKDDQQPSSCYKFHNNVWFQKIFIHALRRVTENTKVKGGLT